MSLSGLLTLQYNVYTDWHGRIRVTWPHLKMMVVCCPTKTILAPLLGLRWVYTQLIQADNQGNILLGRNCPFFTLIKTGNVRSIGRSFNVFLSWLSFVKFRIGHTNSIERTICNEQLKNEDGLSADAKKGISALLRDVDAMCDDLRLVLSESLQFDVVNALFIEKMGPFLQSTRFNEKIITITTNQASFPLQRILFSHLIRITREVGVAAIIIQYAAAAIETRMAVLPYRQCLIGWQCDWESLVLFNVTN